MKLPRKQRLYVSSKEDALWFLDLQRRVVENFFTQKSHNGPFTSQKSADFKRRFF
jgi:hypothetical protein